MVPTCSRCVMHPRVILLSHRRRKAILAGRPAEIRFKVKIKIRPQRQGDSACFAAPIPPPGQATPAAHSPLLRTPHSKTSQFFLHFRPKGVARWRASRFAGALGWWDHGENCPSLPRERPPSLRVVGLWTACERRNVGVLLRRGFDGVSMEFRWGFEGIGPFSPPRPPLPGLGAGPVQPPSSVASQSTQV